MSRVLLAAATVVVPAPLFIVTPPEPIDSVMPEPVV